MVQAAVFASFLLAYCSHGILTRRWLGLLFAYQQVCNLNMYVQRKLHTLTMTIFSEFVKMKFGYDNVHAAATASVAQIAPVFLMPILGLCLDKYGKRTWMSKSTAYNLQVI